MGVYQKKGAACSGSLAFHFSASKMREHDGAFLLPRKHHARRPAWDLFDYHWYRQWLRCKPLTVYVETHL